MIFSYVAVIITVCLCLRHAERKSGMYSLSLTSIGECPDGGTNEIIFNTRISKISKNSICYSGWVSLPFGLTDDIQEHWDVSTKGSTGGWKAHFMSFRHKHACSGTKRFFPQWFKVLEAANLSDTSCPIPKGNYSFNCLDLSGLQFDNIYVLLFGTYRLTVTFFVNSIKVGCTMFEGEILPRN